MAGSQKHHVYAQPRLKQTLNFKQETYAIKLTQKHEEEEEEEEACNLRDVVLRSGSSRA